MSAAFILLLACFVLITLYSFLWPRLIRGDVEFVADPAPDH